MKKKGVRLGYLVVCCMGGGLIGLGLQSYYSKAKSSPVGYKDFNHRLEKAEDAMAKRLLKERNIPPSANTGAASLD